jgi:hypothetical protein
MRPLDHPWGDGNWWLTQMVKRLRERGHDVRFDLRRGPDCVVVVDRRVGGNVGLGAGDVAAQRTAELRQHVLELEPPARRTRATKR